MNRLQILTGDCREILPALEAGSVQCCVSSPPYWGLRDYGTAQWEGGSVWCEHIQKVSPIVDGHFGDYISGETTRGTRKYNAISFRETCGKCGARRIDVQLGLESTPEEYIAKMVRVFREVRRVLRLDGTLWVNMGDSYNSELGKRKPEDKPGDKQSTNRGSCTTGSRNVPGLKPKDLCMMPARLAMALQADGWYLRSEIVWHKPNPMPESVTDRPTKAHEMIYLLAKNGGKPLIWRARDTGEWSQEPDLSQMIPQPRGWRPGDPDPDGNFHKGFRSGQYCNNQSFDNDSETGRPIIGKRSVWSDEPVPRWKGFDYFYDAEAIRERSTEREVFGNSNGKTQLNDDRHDGGRRDLTITEFRNKRSVWTIATQPYSEAHFATFPEEIPKLCILAGSKPGDTVLDPFAGSGTTGKVAIELGRKAILIELNPEYMRLARARTCVTPGFF
jgi:site-specific DNA-methyltransferase (adenine-specific)